MFVQAKQLRKKDGTLVNVRWCAKCKMWSTNHNTEEHVPLAELKARREKEAQEKAAKEKGTNPTADADKGKDKETTPTHVGGYVGAALTGIKTAEPGAEESMYRARAAEAVALAAKLMLPTSATK